MTTDAASVVVVFLFAAFAAVVAFLIRPRDRRRHVDATDDAPTEQRRRSADRSD